MTTQTAATIVADSISPIGIRVTTTCLHHLETVELVHGTIPAPGGSSAGCLPWDAPAILRAAREAAGVN